MKCQYLRALEPQSPVHIIQDIDATLKSVMSATGCFVANLEEICLFDEVVPCHLVVQLYNGSLKMRLGITAGICLLMKHYPGMGTADMHKLPFFVPDHYETIMTWHFGDLGIISGQV